MSADPTRRYYFFEPRPKTLRRLIVSLLLFLAPLPAGAATSESLKEQLATAIRALAEADSYSWRLSRCHALDPSSVRDFFPFAAGRTAKSGYSVAHLATTKNVRVAFFGAYAAIDTEKGWRRTETLTEAEIDAEFVVPDSWIPSKRQQYIFVRTIRHVPLHVLLEIALPSTRYLHREGDEIVASLDLAAAVHIAVEILTFGKTKDFRNSRRRTEEDAVRAGLFDPRKDAVVRVSAPHKGIERVTFELNLPHLGYHYPHKLILVTDVSAVGASPVDVSKGLQDAFSGVSSRATTASFD